MILINLVDSAQNEAHLAKLLKTCEQNLDRMFLVGEKIQLKVLKEILEVIGILIWQSKGIMFNIEVKLRLSIKSHQPCE